MELQGARTKRGEQGVALLVAVFALLMVTSIAVGMMFLTDTETAVNSNFRDEQTGYYASKAGLEEARDRMRWNAGSGVTISSSLPTAKPGAAGGVLYILNPTGSETVAPWSSSNAYYDDEICKEVSCSGGSVPPTSGWYVSPALTANSAYASSPVLPYKWMRITLKIDQSAAGSSNVFYVDGKSADAAYYVCWTGTHEVASSTACALPNKPVYLLTTLAVTTSGTRRMLQYELTQDQVSLAVPGALTLDGTTDVMDAASSNSYDVNGHDQGGCGGSATSGSVPAVAVNDAADKTTVTTGIPSNRSSNYTGSGSSSPDVEVATMPPSLATVSGLQSLVTTVKNNATQTLTGPVTSLSSPGTAASPQIIVVNGDLTLSGNTTGYGILLVTGTYTASGTIGWNGLVLVVGKGIVIGTGGGSNQYKGAMIVAQTTNPLTGAALTSLGSPTYNWSGGGGNGVFYSSSCLQSNDYLANYRVVSSHELLY